jgi:hypothetical protein
MYNVFKRPMFKLGGQADQGTGIMSTVEPRQNYMFGNIAQPLTPFQNTYIELPAYAYGGRIGYQNAGPVLPGTLPTIPSPFGITPPTPPVAGTSKSETGILSMLFGPSADEKLLIEKGMLSPNATARERIQAIQNLKLARQSGQKVLEEDITPSRESTSTKDIKFKETKTTDPRSEIRKEADMLKDLLKNEGLTTAENALIVARALATPGGFNAKIQAAADLALPIARERAKLDKEAVLKAYETNKEIKKAQIAAGNLSVQQKLINQRIENIKSTSKQVTRDPDGTIRYDGLTEAEIEDRVLGPIFGKYTTKELDVKVLETRKLEEKLREEESKPKPDPKIIQSLRDKINVNKELYNLKADGGRIKKAIGGMSNMETTVEDITDDTTGRSETIIDTNVEGFPEKAVKKLSFEEIRNRLPKEITDDIVRLISSSAEALQDFAYIKTQQDVNQFNVKYGVNLVLPQNA